MSTRYSEGMRYPLETSPPLITDWGDFTRTSVCWEELPSFRRAVERYVSRTPVVEPVAEAPMVPINLGPDLSYVSSYADGIGYT